MSAPFLIRHAGWSILNPLKARNAVKAMALYRKSHPVCEITGSDNKVQVHHIVPVWANPDLADDPNNMISLSASAHVHLLFGHNGNFGKYYVENIKEIAEQIRAVKSTSKIVERDSERVNNLT